MTKGTRIGFVVWHPMNERDSGGPKRFENEQLFFLVHGPNVYFSFIVKPSVNALARGIFPLVHGQMFFLTHE